MRGGPSSFGRGLWRVARRVLTTSRTQGFTIVEVLIVLAVTAALFISATVLIAGRQNQTAFEQAIQQIRDQIQQAINDVSVGYYPQIGTFQCTASGSGPLLSAGTAKQGTNSDCIFLGKVIQFAAGNTNPEQVVTYTAAGLKNGGGSGAATSSLSQAKPVMVAPSTSHNNAGYPNINVIDKLQSGLTTARMWYNNGAGDVEIGAVGIIFSLDEFTTSGGSIKSGTGQVDVVAVGGTSLHSDTLSTAELLNGDSTGGNKLAGGTSNPVNPTAADGGGVFICFASGTTKQYGIVQIGGAGRTLTVSLKIKDNTGTCTNT